MWGSPSSKKEGEPPPSAKRRVPPLPTRKLRRYLHTSCGYVPDLIILRHAARFVKVIKADALIPLRAISAAPVRKFPQRIRNPNQREQSTHKNSLAQPCPGGALMQGTLAHFFVEVRSFGVNVSVHTHFPHDFKRRTGFLK
jgi:hypothetical protein